MKILDLYVAIQGDISDLSKALDTSEKQLLQFSRKASEIGDKLTKDLTGPIIKLGKEIVNAAAESEAAQKKLQNALKATGQEVNANTKSIENLAAALQEQTRFEDDAIVSSAALLTQLGQLDAQGVQKVLPGILDFAEAMGVDLETAAQLVAKTLGSNTNALARYGVDVDGSADKTTKLAAITEQLSAKFGGAANAAGETFSGRLAQLQNTVGDLAEEFGKALLPVLTDLIEFVKPIVQSFAGLDDQTKGLILGLGGLVAAAGPLASVIGNVGKAMDLLAKNPVFGVIGAGVAIVVGATQALNALQDSIHLTAEEAGQAADNIKSLSDQAQAVIGPVSSLNAQQLLSRDKVEELTELYPELTSQLKLNETTYLQAAEAVRLINLQKQQELKNEIELQRLRQRSIYLQADETIRRLEAQNQLSAYDRAQLDAARSIEKQYLDLTRAYQKADAEVRILSVSVAEQIRQQEAATAAAAKNTQAVSVQATTTQTAATQTTEVVGASLESQKQLYKDKDDYIQSLQEARQTAEQQAAIDAINAQQAIADQELDIWAANIAAQQEAELQAEQERIDSFARQEQAFKASMERELATFNSILDRSKALATDWSGVIDSALGGAKTAFGNIFETIGEGVVTGTLSWELLAKVALESISVILRGLGEQLLAKSIAYAVEAAAAAASIIGLPLVPGLTAASGIMAGGAAGAFIASGVVKGLSSLIKAPTSPPAFAMGTDWAPGGMALVGEQGPELVNLARGSQVLTNARTESILQDMSSSNKTYNFYSPRPLDTWEIKKAIERQGRLERLGLNG